MTNLATTTPTAPAYQTRPIRFLKHWEHHGWKLKLYGISGKGDAPPAAFCAAAEALLPTALPADARADGRYGVGFAIIHEGLDGYFLLVDWWVQGNMLKQRVLASQDGCARFEDFAHTEIVGCVWEICVLAFERDAFVKHVLRRPNDPNLAGYLSETLNVDA